MRSMAHALIQRRYVEQGKTTRIVVLPLPGSGLPDQLVGRGQPVPLDLLSGRPVHLELDEQGLAADLCFGGPPTRCRFPWEAVAAVQGPGDDLVHTLAVTVAIRMEDDTLEPAALDTVLARADPEDEEAFDEDPAPTPPPRTKGTRRGKPQLRLCKPTG